MKRIGRKTLVDPRSLELNCEGKARAQACPTLLCASSSSHLCEKVFECEVWKSLEAGAKVKIYTSTWEIRPFVTSRGLRRELHEMWQVLPSFLILDPLSHTLSLSLSLSFHSLSHLNSIQCLSVGPVLRSAATSSTSASPHFQRGCKSCVNEVRGFHFW